MYCRTGCPSASLQRRNAVFLATAAAAEQAGLCAGRS
ncbi:MAG: hypothetical protein GDA41_06880 [Rhodospirillales bacterium]|nr:hypothetical protein [Rhodospirillales bacterium]